MSFLGYDEGMIDLADLLYIGLHYYPPKIQEDLLKTKIIKN